mmetsp:Transcript_78837/g.198080  ORF Transcript_78837/g.198080 Transcript_78837/m.198080 type:complete len:212 (+) Transcript_78837:913-1548(+)
MVPVQSAPHKIRRHVTPLRQYGSCCCEKREVFGRRTAAPPPCAATEEPPDSMSASSGSGPPTAAPDCGVAAAAVRVCGWSTREVSPAVGFRRKAILRGAVGGWSKMKEDLSTPPAPEGPAKRRRQDEADEGPAGSGASWALSPLPDAATFSSSGQLCRLAPRPEDTPKSACELSLSAALGLSSTGWISSASRNETRSRTRPLRSGKNSKSK